MDVEFVRRKTHTALAGLKDLDPADAIDMAMFDLSEILAHVGNDADVPLIAVIERHLSAKGYTGEGWLTDERTGQLLPGALTSEHTDRANLVAC